VNEGEYRALVKAANGGIKLDFRTYYEAQQPDRRLCVPLASFFLQHGGDALLMELARNGFGQFQALRNDLDNVQNALAELEGELANVDTGLSTFEENYNAVNHGPTHHAVKAKEHASLLKAKEDLPKQIHALGLKATSLVWQSAPHHGVAVAFAHLAAELRRQVTAAGAWVLTMFMADGTVHTMGVQAYPGGEVMLFDPDWAFVEFPSVDDLGGFLVAMLNKTGVFGGGRMEIAKVG
jgi:hypothetical protein